jgi:hypothetical protein
MVAHRTRRCVRWALGCASLALALGCGEDAPAHGSLPAPPVPPSTAGAAAAAGAGAGSVAPASSPECSVEGALYCSEDGASAARCESQLLVPTGLRCLGNASGCGSEPQSDSFTCGSGLDLRVYAQAGSPCADDGQTACAFDRKSVVWCRDGAWVQALRCGPAACVELPGMDSGSFYGCSNRGASPGDLCELENGAGLCSADLRHVLQCASGSFAVSETCGSGEECRRRMDADRVIIDCVASGYDAGDLCHFPDGMRLCSVDSSEVLVCTAGSMAVDTACGSGSTCEPFEEHGAPSARCR